MARVRVRVLGAGVVGDPLRVDLPTFVMVGLPVGGTVTVDIPDQDAPPGVTLGPLPLAQLDADGHAAWHTLLDSRYTEHVGQFRPVVA